MNILERIPSRDHDRKFENQKVIINPLVNSEQNYKFSTFIVLFTPFLQDTDSFFFHDYCKIMSLSEATQTCCIVF